MLTVCFFSILKQKFLIPLKQNKLISAEDVSTMFSNVEVIYGVNQQLLDSLEKAIKNWSPSQKIGQIFLKMVNPCSFKKHVSLILFQSHLLRMYTPYVKVRN